MQETIRAYRNTKVAGWGDVPIHYTAYGHGEPTIVCCNGVGVSTFFWKYVIRHFASHHRVITWDYRGHNTSGLPPAMVPSHFTMEVNAHDLRAVMDDAGVDRAVLLGHSMGCQVLFEFWHQFPDRVAGLIPICGAFGKPIDTALGMPQVAHPVFGVFYTLATTSPRLLEQLTRPLLRSDLPFQIARLGRVINPELADADDMAPYFHHLGKMNIEVFFLMAGEMQKHNAGPWLHEIDAPTLVVGGEHDLLSPMELSHYMQRRIPDAELLMLPRGSHAGLIEHPDLLNLRVEKFLRERVEPFLATKRKRRPRRAAPKTRRSSTKRKQRAVQA